MNPNPFAEQIDLSPQEAFEQLLLIERDMSQLITLASGVRSPMDRRDAVSRIAVACEGNAKLLEYILSHPSNLVPCREDFLALLPIFEKRLNGIQAALTSGGMSTGSMAAIAYLVDLTIDPIERLVSKLGYMQCVEVVAAFIRWIGGPEWVQRASHAELDEIASRPPMTEEQVRELGGGGEAITREELASRLAEKTGYPKPQ